MTTVADLYTQVLGRAPDAEGLFHWTNAFGESVDPTEAATFLNVAQAELANRTPAEQAQLAPNLVNSSAVSTPTTAATSAASPTSYLESVKAQLTPEQYQQLVAPLTFTANENFGGNVQDWQVQLLTPLDTSKLNFPKKVDESTAGVRQISDGFISTEPTMVNGVPVYAKYDTSGNLSAYQGDNLKATTWTNGENRLVGNWDPSGKAAPISIASQTGLFNTGYHWNDIRDNLEAAAVVAGNYVLPGSSLLTGNLVTKGAQENLNTDAGRLINMAAGAAGGFAGNTANYGQIAESAGLTEAGSTTGATTGGTTGGSTMLDYSAPTAQGGLGLQGTAALDGTLSSGLAAPAGGSLGGGLGLTAGTAGNIAAMGGAQGLLANAAGGGTLSAGGINTGLFTADNLASTLAGGGSAAATLTDTLKNLTPTQVAQLAKAGISVAGLLGGAAAVGGLTGGGNTNLTLPAQNRAGISSGSAQYSPEYYQAIQAKYNQMMPQQPRDVTTELKNWYETKYAPKVA